MHVCTFYVGETGARCPVYFRIPKLQLLRRLTVVTNCANMTEAVFLYVLTPATTFVVILCFVIIEILTCSDVAILPWSRVQLHPVVQGKKPRTKYVS